MHSPALHRSLAPALIFDDVDDGIPITSLWIGKNKSLEQESA